jgi:SAM-dependent methyltransferase
LRGHERILDLACGFGRHTLELARRGYSAVGVDITAAYIADARSAAQHQHLAAEFLQADVRSVLFEDEFDVVLNMADGAIGYFETDEENLRLFDVIGRALRNGGKHVMGVCSAAHAKKHFPKRHWEAGQQSLSLADFEWKAATSRMLYRGRVLKYGEILKPFPNEFPASGDNGIRLYTLEELGTILHQRGLCILAAYGAYDTSIPASEDRLMQVVCSQKERNVV